jgi:predicted metal-binding membrane protein
MNASALDRGIATLVRRDRALVLGSLAVVVALAWLYLWHSAMAMDMGAGKMPMAGMPSAWDATTLSLTFVMWSVMMAGMMLPSAAPAILLYGTLVRRNGVRGTVLPGAWSFAGAYLLVWSGFSAAATLLQSLLERVSLMSPAMATTSTWLGAGALIAAGLYQLTPLKRTCLRKCRNPLEFFITRWHTGTLGALRMGLAHGAYCVGCCWALMLLLFVVGVMNLAWVAFISAFVLAEKLLPGARVLAYGASAALIGSGLLMLRGAGTAGP